MKIRLRLTETHLLEKTHLKQLARYIADDKKMDMLIADPSFLLNNKLVWNNDRELHYTKPSEIIKAMWDAKVLPESYRNRIQYFAEIESLSKAIDSFLEKLPKVEKVLSFFVQGSENILPFATDTTDIADSSRKIGRQDVYKKASGNIE